MLANLREQIPAFRAQQVGQIAVRRSEELFDPPDLVNALWNNVTVFVKTGPECIHQFGPLAHEAFPGTEEDGSALLLFRFRLDEAHLGPLGRNDDRLGIGGIVLLTLHKRLHVLRRDQLHFMALPGQFPCPVMGAAAGLQHDHCGRLLGHESEEGRTRELFAKRHLARQQRSMKLENGLCQINANHQLL